MLLLKILLKKFEQIKRRRLKEFVFPEALVITMIVENNTMKPNQIRKKEEWWRKCPIYADDFF